MKSLVGVLVVLLSITGCKKSNDSEPVSPTFEAVIDGTAWKATTFSAVLNPDQSGVLGNFNITGYTNDGRVIYLRTKENKASNLSFREQVVNLISLTATTNVIEAKINLTWRTSSELHADKFDVERSIDGTNFVKVVAIKAKGTSDTVNTYSHTDRPPFSDPFNNTTYYRLRMIDLDGSFALSPVIVVRFDSPAIYKFTNSASDYSYGFLGNINLTEVNTQKRTISGTFSFSYTNGSTGLLGKVENGLFRNVPY